MLRLWFSWETKATSKEEAACDCQTHYSWHNSTSAGCDSYQNGVPKQQTTSASAFRKERYQGHGGFHFA